MAECVPGPRSLAQPRAAARRLGATFAVARGAHEKRAETRRDPRTAWHARAHAPHAMGELAVLLDVSALVAERPEDGAALARAAPLARVLSGTPARCMRYRQIQPRARPVHRREGGCASP